MIPIHCSSLGLIMTDARSIDPKYLVGDLAVIAKKKVKTESEKELLRPLLEKTLSAGAKTELKSIAKEFVYGFHKVVTTKYMSKGLAVEDKCIELYNNVLFTNYKKNKIRKNDSLLTGEVDIDTGKRIIDIKASWDWDTFPAVSEDGIDSMYEWQGRGYMRLWDRDEFENAFCMVDTPDELLRYEQPELHIASHIPPNMRVTRVEYFRDMNLEKKIEIKVHAAQEYLANMVAQIAVEHNY